MDEFILSELDKSLWFYPLDWKPKSEFDRIRALEFIMEGYHHEAEEYQKARQFRKELDQRYCDMI